LRGRPAPRRDAALRLLWDYLTSADVFVRGQAPVEVPANPDEASMLREAQRFLRRRLAGMPISVEVNPSSNMLVGDLRLEEHPAFRLYPFPDAPPTDEARVPIALGDDDPITFATHLGDE